LPRAIGGQEWKIQPCQVTPELSYRTELNCTQANRSGAFDGGGTNVCQLTKNGAANFCPTFLARRGTFFGGLKEEFDRAMNSIAHFG